MSKKNNPLAAESPDEEIIQPSVPGPSEFDPDSDPHYTDELSIPSSIGEVFKEAVENTVHDSGIEAPSETGLNILGHLAKPDFDPRDESKGFYQGIDPSTGERIFSERK